MGREATMKAIWVVAAGLAWAGCSPLHERSEDWQQYYSAPVKETEMENLERERIFHWVKDPSAKERVGILEKNRMRLKGMREWQEMYYILNAGGTEKLGFINERGVFYRYDAKGHLVLVGEYPVIDTGLKIFLGYPLSHNLALERIDPYRE